MKKLMLMFVCGLLASHAVAGTLADQVGAILGTENESRVKSEALVQLLADAQWTDAEVIESAASWGRNGSGISHWGAAVAAFRLALRTGGPGYARQWSDEENRKAFVSAYVDAARGSGILKSHYQRAFRAHAQALDPAEAVDVVADEVRALLTKEQSPERDDWIRELRAQHVILRELAQ